MSPKSILWSRVLALLVVLVGLTVAERAQAFVAPSPEGAFTDRARVVDPARRAAIQQKLVDFRRSTGHEVVVVTVASLEGATVEDASYEIARAWRLGAASRDDGVLLFVAVRERKTRIEVGRGAGGALTDVEAGRILRERVAPELGRGAYAVGIENGVDAILAALSSLPPAPSAVAPGPRPRTLRDRVRFELRGLAALVLFAVPLVWLVLRYRAFSKRVPRWAVPRVGFVTETSSAARASTSGESGAPNVAAANAPPEVGGGGSFGGGGASADF